MCLLAAGASVVGEGWSVAVDGGTRCGLVQSGSDRESFKAASEAEAAPCLSSRVSRWFRLRERT